MTTRSILSILTVLALTSSVGASLAYTQSYDRLIIVTNTEGGPTVQALVRVDSFGPASSLDLSYKVSVFAQGRIVDTLTVPFIVSSGAMVDPLCKADCTDNGCLALSNPDHGFACLHLNLAGENFCWCASPVACASPAAGQTFSYLVQPLSGALPEINTSDDFLTVSGGVGVPALGVWGASTLVAIILTASIITIKRRNRLGQSSEMV
jgi:hypothetical protein